MRSARRSPHTVIFNVSSSHVHRHAGATVMLPIAGTRALEFGLRTRSPATSRLRRVLPAAAFSGKPSDVARQVTKRPRGTAASLPLGPLPRSRAAPSDDSLSMRSSEPALTRFQAPPRHFFVPTLVRVRTTASPHVPRPSARRVGVAPRFAPIGLRTAGPLASTKQVTLLLRRQRIPSQRAAMPEDARSAAAMLKRSPELVWRALVAGTAGALEEGTRMHARTEVPPPPQRIELPRAAMQARSSATRANDDMRSMLLDPALVDRLADDVIRRVERRIRIERERRGI